MAATHYRRTVRLLLCLLIVAGTTAICFALVHVNATTAALIMLLVVLGVATQWGLAEGAFTSFAAMLAFNYYFLPPIGALTIAEPPRR